MPTQEELLEKAEKIINRIDEDTRYVPIPFNRIMIWIGMINDYKNYKKRLQKSS